MIIIIIDQFKELYTVFVSFLQLLPGGVSSATTERLGVLESLLHLFQDFGRILDN